MNMPSLCIPRVFPNIDEKRIRKIFDELQIGNIERIDIINKKTEKGEKYNRVFIHFNIWYNNSNANQTRDRLLNGKDIKIIYDDPWFWKVSAYRSNNKKPDENKTYKTNNQNKNTKPKIIFDEKQEVSTAASPVTIFKPRVLTNKHINPIITKNQKNKQPTLLKIEEEEEIA